ncbi:MAG: hypothetical protein AAF602_16975 [Myxococcota bacterium]
MRVPLLLAVLVGCSNEIGLRSRAPTPPFPETSDGVPLRCLDAAIESVPIDFSARDDCDFGRRGNLDPRNGFVQARAVAEQAVELPPGALLCSASLESDGAPVTFDDHLALLLDDVVLVSGGSGGAIDDYPVVDGLPRFDWTEVRGRPFAERYTPYECLGGARCVVPRTEETGPLDVEIPAPTMVDLVDALAIEGNFDIRIVVFGDDDVGDCAFSDLTLDLVMRYVR